MRDEQAINVLQFLFLKHSYEPERPVKLKNKLTRSIDHTIKWL
jgi:hypothetical protein